MLNHHFSDFHEVLFVVNILGMNSLMSPQIGVDFSVKQEHNITVQLWDIGSVLNHMLRVILRLCDHHIFITVGIHT